MAKRPVFLVGSKEDGYVREINTQFEWFPGFSLQQKQKSIRSLHDEFNRIEEGKRVLEISSKSETDLGVKLSAFNLEIKTKKSGKSFTVETAFQSSKVFEKGGPYRDLLEKSSREAKRDPRLRNSGDLVHFDYFGRIWPLTPKTLFYDWLYVNALSMHEELANQVILYDAFTDIEFNPEKSINCQAKSSAIYVALYRTGLLDKALSSPESFKALFSEGIKKDSDTMTEENTQQLSIFD
ncbi:DarT1-associated NADAR antitoxin family protein [Neobacillus dielmonensis]|uniref:DarT1-associated NADAR antitoxin family protein n=1 Tax=Neobacillus dielmonensis TaxID=1347369 RepID=UPI0005AA7597|nr:hypothetical protein [Neobacillus dielmonensis]